jgi:hypothetical protein
MSPTRSGRRPGNLARPFSRAGAPSFGDATPSGCQARIVADRERDARGRGSRRVDGAAATAGSLLLLAIIAASAVSDDARTKAAHCQIVQKGRPL